MIKKKDLYVKGNYIVMATRHIFTQSEYQTVLEAVKILSITTTKNMIVLVW